MDEFLTIARPSEGLYKEKGSKFIGYAFPVLTEDEIKAHLQALREEHHAARHHCYAWVLGAGGDHVRANDDGEPSNSSGKPILAQLEGRSLTNTLIVVVRYFGGTKLGVGGLINAYRTAASEALDQAAIITDYVTQPVKLQFPYTETSYVQRMLNELSVETVNEEFGEDCKMLLKVRRSQLERLNQTLGAFIV